MPPILTDGCRAAAQQAVCQCRRSSSPVAVEENVEGSTGQARVCGVAGRITWWQPGQR